MRIGIYRDQADNQYFPTSVHRKAETQSDMRWWKQTDSNGFGLTVKSCQPFYAYSPSLRYRRVGRWRREGTAPLISEVTVHQPLPSMANIMEWEAELLGRMAFGSLSRTCRQQELQLCPCACEEIEKGESLLHATLKPHSLLCIRF